MFAFLLACNRVNNVPKQISKELNRVDSFTKVAADSLKTSLSKSEIKNETAVEKQLENLDVQTERKLLTATYASILKSMQNKDTVILTKFLYFPDSLITIRSQGIFQIIDYEPAKSLFSYEYSTPNPKAWSCTLDFSSYPQMTNTGWSKQGCFAKRVTNFKGFTAVIELNKEAHLPVSAKVLQKVKQVEHLVEFQVVNTYLGFTFYFTYKDGSFYLVGVSL
jgi:hypothetical protein